MWETRVLVCRCVGLVSLSLPALLVGCQWQHIAAAGQARPQANQADTSPNAVPVQQSPEYRAAVRLFARRDYPAALAGINALLQQPQYRNRPADLDFLPAAAGHLPARR